METQTEQPTALLPEMPAAPDGSALTDQQTEAWLDEGRKVRLTIARVDPWSVMKLAFLLAIGLAIVAIVAAALLWVILDVMHVWSNLEELLQSFGNDQFIRLLDMFRFNRVLAFTTLISIVNVVLLTALATVGAFLYNVVAGLLGGINVTLAEN